MNKNIKLLFTFTFIKDINLINAVILPLLLAFSLGTADYFWIMSAFRITQFIIMLPMGMMIDRLGSITSLRLSAFFYFLAFIVLCYSQSLLGFIIYSVLCAFSAGFSDSVIKLMRKLEPDHEKYIHFFSINMSLRKLAIAAAGILMAVALVFFDYKTIIYIQTFMAFLSVLPMLFISDIEEERNSISFSILKTNIKNAPYRRIFQTMNVSLPFLVALDLCLQPLLVAANISKTSFPLIITLVNVITFLTLANSKKITYNFKVSGMMQALMPLCPFLLYIISGNAWLGLVGLLATIISRSYSIKSIGELIASVPEKERGFVGSMLNTMVYSSVSIISFASGFLLKTLSYYQVSIVVFILMVVMTIIIEHFSKEKQDTKIETAEVETV